MPTLYNLIVDNVVLNWPALTVEEKLVAYEGLGIAAGQCLELFYAGDRMMGLRDL